MPGFLSSVGDIIKGSSSQTGHLYIVSFQCPVNINGDNSLSDTIMLFVKMIITEPIDDSLTGNQKSAFLANYINNNVDKLLYCGGAKDPSLGNNYPTWANLALITQGSTNNRIGVYGQGIIKLNGAFAPVNIGQTNSELEVLGCTQLI